MNSPRRQHWVPRFYLKFFATNESRAEEKPRVWTYSEGSEPKLIGVNDIALENNIYSPVQDTGERDYEIEKRLAALEGICAKVWHTFAEADLDFPSNTSIKQLLAFFIAVQITRTPRHRDLVSHLQRWLVSEFDRLTKDENGRPIASTIQIGEQTVQIDNSGWDNFKNASEDDVKRMFVEQLQKNPQRVAALVLTKRWAIMRAPEPSFATSDCPVRFIDSDDQSRG